MLLEIKSICLCELIYQKLFPSTIARMTSYWNHTAWQTDFAMIHKNEVFLKFLSAQVGKRPFHHDNAGIQCKVEFYFKN